MIEFRAFLLNYGFATALGLGLLVLLLFMVARHRERARDAARARRRARNIAAQRTWDWLMRRSSPRFRITYQPPGEDRD